MFEPKCIWKYEVPVGDVVNLNIPCDAVLKDARNDFDKMTLWFEVDPKAPRMDNRDFLIVATGEVYEANYRHIATDRHDQSGLVWTVVERYRP